MPDKYTKRAIQLTPNDVLCLSHQPNCELLAEFLRLHAIRDAEIWTVDDYPGVYILVCNPGIAVPYALWQQNDCQLGSGLDTQMPIFRMFRGIWDGFTAHAAIHGEKWRRYLCTESDITNENRGVLGITVDELKLPIRVQKAMWRLQVTTLGELLLKSPDDLLECKNFGETCLRVVRAKLAEYNLHLRDDFPSQPYL